MPMTPEQHQEHMAKVEQGLNAILQSQDINEVHQIAQSLLAEEQGEVQAETGDDGTGAGTGEDLRSKLMAAANKGGM